MKQISEINKIEVNSYLFLEPISIKYAEDLFSLIKMNRDFLSEWLDFVRKTKHVDDSKVFIEKAINRFKEDKGVEFGMIFKGKLVGMIGLHKYYSEHEKLEIGYWLSREFNGEGLVSSSVKKIIGVLLAELGINRVELIIAEGNVKSIALADRLAFRLEGKMKEYQKINGELHDYRLYAILKKDYKYRNI